MKRPKSHRYAIFVTGHDEMGPWEPDIYGPYATEEEAQAVANQIEEETRLYIVDMPLYEWSMEAVVCEFLPPDQLLKRLHSKR